MGSTNYLPTGADLSDAMVKEQNLQMEDTSEFYKQMAELEKQRAERPLNLLGDIADFAQSAGPVFKQIAQANQDRNKFKGELEAYDAEQETIRLEIEEGKRPINTKVVAQTNLENLEKDSRNEQLKAKETAKTDSTDPTLSQEDRYVAADAAAIFGEGSFSYQEGLNSRNNAKAFAGQVSRYFDVGSRDDRFTSLDNKVLNDMSTRDEAKAHLNNLQAIILQNYIRQRRQLGLRELSDGEVLKYIAPDLFKAKQKLLNIWQENRDQTQLKLQKMRDSDEISSMFANKDTLANDILGKQGWITNRKSQLEAGGADPSGASQIAFEEFGELLIPMFDDVASGVDAGDGRILLNIEFDFPGGRMKLSDPRAPKGAQRLAEKIQAAVIKYDEDAIEREEETNKLEIAKWEETNHVEFEAKIAKMTDPRQIADEVDLYILDFRKRFNITDDEALPEFMKNFITSREFADDAIVVEIRSRRRNNLPITQSMIDKIADPDIREEQSQYVNTPELGAFTEEEAKNLEDEKIPTLVRDAKQLSDLSKAKTDKFLVARDNAKVYITDRFKELVVGGQSRSVALNNAIREAKGFLKDGTFDKEEILPIDVQATKDLQSTLNALSKDPSLIYSSEDLAGETPHLDIAAEYRRTGGRSRYPSYYLRFNFIKDSDGSYLTPEEFFDTRLEKTGRMKDGRIIKLPEREELKNDDGTANVEDQNKLLNKNNPTKTLEVATKNNNIEWMIKTKPSVSELNAEMFIRQLETNIQRQQFITGINIPHKQKTTLSKEDNDKLLEAVPELKEAPFLNPNTLSTAAINEMLNLNI
tara:strand:- start:223 stop:2661 length:2439 start_codon:yes stop_codon:yes gene_type:complete